MAQNFSEQGISVKGSVNNIVILTNQRCATNFSFGFLAEPNNHAKYPRLPMLRRSAIQANGIVVWPRNSRANATFRRSPLRQVFNSASLHPSRFNPAVTRRSARACSPS